MLVQALADVEMIRVLPPKVFWPRPKVDSAVVLIVPRPEKRALIQDLAWFHAAVRRIFLHRRKNLRGVLYSTWREAWTKPEVDALLEGLGLTGEIRAETMNVEEWISLTDALKVRPIRNPQTIAKSLAIGDPADGYFASLMLRDSGGWGEDVTDDEIVQGMTLLAETEGIFSETAGGVTLAVARKLIAQGKLDPTASTVLCITGNGLKTQEALLDHIPRPKVIDPKLEQFEALVGAAPAEFATVGA